MNIENTATNKDETIEKIIHINLILVKFYTRVNDIFWNKKTDTIWFFQNIYICRGILYS